MAQRVNLPPPSSLHSAGGGRRDGGGGGGRQGDDAVMEEFNRSQLERSEPITAQRLLLFATSTATWIVPGGKERGPRNKMFLFYSFLHTLFPLCPFVFLQDAFICFPPAVFNP